MDHGVDDVDSPCLQVKAVPDQATPATDASGGVRAGHTYLSWEGGELLCKLDTDMIVKSKSPLFSLTTVTALMTALIYRSIYMRLFV